MRLEPLTMGHLERLVDGCEETIERMEEVLANREAELSE